MSSKHEMAIEGAPESLPSCVVVGEGAFALEGLELLRRQFRIVGVVSPDGSLSRWASARSITHEGTKHALTSMLEERVDYLFSLNNPLVLTPAHLAKVGKLAVNYHDSPLPRYGGLHATSWAIIEGQTEHGITLHVVEPGLDTGDALVRRTFPVSNDERAYSLNATCFEAGLEALRELLERITAGNVERTPLKGKPSYFGQQSRPRDGGVFDWNRSAAALERLSRGLDFGRTANTLCDPLLWTGTRFVVPGDVRLFDGTGVPGQILHRRPLRVACSEGAVEIGTLRSFDGVRLDPKTVLEDGPTLHLPGFTGPLSEEMAQVARYEAFWCRRLQLAPLVLELERHEDGPVLRELGEFRSLCECLAETLAADILLTDALLPADAAGRAGQQYESDNIALTLLASVVKRLAPKSDAQRIAFSGPEQRALHGELYAREVPLRIDKIDGAAGDAIERMKKEVARVRKRGSYPLDAPARHHLPADSSVPPAILVVHGADSTHSAKTLGEMGRGGIALLLADDGYALWSGQAAPRLLASLDGALCQLAQAVISSPKVALHELPLVGAEAERALEPHERGTDLVLDDRTVVDRIQEFFSDQRSHPALHSGERTLTYAELGDRSEAVARGLVLEGLQRGQMVGIAIADPMDFVVAALGSMLAGGAYVPLDPDMPEVRTDQIIEDAKLEVVLSDQAQSEPSERARQLSRLEKRGEGLATKLPTISLEDRAYVIFTSGTTGRPKGVEVHHRQLAAQLLARREDYGEDPSSFLINHSLSFDSAVAGLTWTLATGGQVVLPLPEARRDPVELCAQVQKHQVSHLDVPPSFYAEVLATPDADSALKGLRVVIVGGEECPATLARKHIVSLPKARLVNEYGPTETTVYCTSHWVPKSADDIAERLPIGRPIANVRALIVNGAGQRVPVGFVGELWIGGPTVTTGYLHRPELTAERFVERYKQRFYRTGDLVRFGAEGELAFFGRVDEQIQIAGHRVELSEIEEALRALEGIEDAVAVCREQGGDQRLFAFVVWSEHGNPEEASTLREILKASLPHYMIPAAIGALIEIPRTPAGKVDRAALPELQVQTQPFEAPQGPHEKLIADEVARALQLQRVGRKDNFFDLGGTSLTAMRVSRALSTLVGSTVKVADFYHHPTISALARHLVDGSSPSWRCLVPIQGGGKRHAIFAIQVLGVGQAYYRPLTQCLGPDQPFYGLTLPIEHDSPEASRVRVPELAQVFTEELLRFQPEGPYLLSGVSAASTVTVEMARLLVAQGKEVPFVFLFDAAGPVEPPKSWKNRAMRHITHLRRDGWSYLKSRYEWRRITVGERSKALKLRMLEALGREVPDSLRVYSMMRGGQQAAQEHQIGEYPGELTVFRAVDETFYKLSYIDQGFGWAAVALGGVNIVDVPGDHLGILKPPNVRVLAERMETLLNTL